MLNLFQHLIKSQCYQTLNQPVKQVQGKVQGDNKGLFQQPDKSYPFFSPFCVIIFIINFSKGTQANGTLAENS
jgi:hypothetical protein